MTEAGTYKAEVRELRRTAAEDLLNLLSSKESICFVDECTIQSQQGKQKTWMHKSRDLVLPQAAVSCHVSVYVACSNMHDGMPIFMLGQSTNSREFVKFLEQIKWSRKDNFDQSFWLVLDGKWLGTRTSAVIGSRLSNFHCEVCT